MHNEQMLPRAQPELVASNYPITNQPSTSVNQVNSNKCLYSSLNVLAECEGVSLKPSDQDPNTIIISSHETGDRLFNATYEYQKQIVGRHNITTIHCIKLYDFMGHQVLATSWQKAQQDSLASEYHVHAGLVTGDQDIGTFRDIAGDWSCNDPYHVFSNSTLAKFDVLSDASHSNCCPICPCTISSFKIQQTTPNGQAGTVVGEMCGRPEDPDAFGITFLKSLSVEEKALLSASGMILYLSYYAKQRCCCGTIQCGWHVGEEGCSCSKWWIFAVFLLLVMTVPIIMVALLVK